MGAEEAITAYLSRPESYPERPHAVTRYETHISHVFAGDSIVYKIKKPVDFGFLDFSTLEKRRFYCAEEVRLNRRLARDIYIGVVPIYLEDGRYSFRRSKGAVIAEYAVKMKRIPEERLLSSLTEKGGLLAGDAAEVGALVARFHRQAPAHRTGPYGGIESVRMNSDENFEQIAAYRGITIDEALYDRLARFTGDFIKGHENGFRERKAAGLVREGHGDLQSRHVCLISPPVIMDCIEFNKRFRISDVLEDIAFLLMDLEHRGRFDLSQAVSRAYFSHFPEAASNDLLFFYKMYRAVVRGKIEGFTAAPLTDPAAGQTARARARDYYSLVRYYMEQSGERFNPVVLMGPAGSGKSEVAKGLVPDALVLRSDEVRKRMAGIRATDHFYVEYGTGPYEAGATEKTYEALTREAVAAARQGRRVVADATFLASALSLNFYEASMSEGLNPFFVWLFADPSVLAARVRGRIEKGTDLSDAHPDVLERQLAIMEGPKDVPSFRVMKLDTGGADPEVIRLTLRSFLEPPLL